MPSESPKSSYSADEATSLQRTREQIKIIGDRSTWLLGFLAVIIAALTSFVFQDLNALIIEYDFPRLKHGVLILLGLYIITACGVLWILMISSTFSSDDAKESTRTLNNLKSVLRGSIIFAIFSLFVIFGFVSYFLYG